MGTMNHCLSYGRKFALASNILFGVLSLAMSIAGFVLRFDDQRMNEATLQKIKDSARDAFGVYDLNTSNFRPITESLKQAFGTLLIVTGIVSAPFAVFGFYTFLRNKRKFLFAYVMFTGFLVAIQLFVSFYFFPSPERMQDLMKPYLRENINEYTGIHTSDQVSLGWNYVMQEYQCCGVDSSADFNSSAYYSSYCPYYGEYNAVPGCCRTLPSSYSNTWCSYYYPTRKYCGGNSYDTYMWKDGCSAALFRFHYTRHTEVIWSMLGVGLIDQIFLFVFAIIVLQKTKCKVQPTGNSTTAVWTTGSTKTSQISSAPMPLREQGISSETLTQHSLPSAYVPATSKPTGAAPPPSQPVMKLIAPTQSNFYPTQPFLPGAVMFVPTSGDYARNTMPNTFIPMTTGVSIQTLPQSQGPPDGQQLNYAPLTMW